MHLQVHLDFSSLVLMQFLSMDLLSTLGINFLHSLIQCSGFSRSVIASTLQLPYMQGTRVHAPVGYYDD